MAIHYFLGPSRHKTFRLLQATFHTSRIYNPERSTGPTFPQICKPTEIYKPTFERSIAWLPTRGRHDYFSISGQRYVTTHLDELPKRRATLPSRLRTDQCWHCSQTTSSATGSSAQEAAGSSQFKFERRLGDGHVKTTVLDSRLEV